MISQCFRVFVGVTLAASMLIPISVIQGEEDDSAARETRLRTIMPRSTRVTFGDAGAKTWSDVEEILKDSGLKGDQLDKVVKRIREVLESRHRTFQLFGFSEKDSKIGGKAVVITSDGKRQEIELSGTGEYPLESVEVKAISSYMIGLNCKPIGDDLRSQLRLGDDVGLVVESVSGDTPASTAGIKQHDVLISANDRDLSSVKDLNVSVQAAGKDKQELSLELIRGGKERTIELTPVERKTLGVEGNYLIKNVEPVRQLRYDWRRIEGPLGPGIIKPQSTSSGSSEIKSLKSKMEELEQQFKILRQEVEGFKASGR